jgi:hypothetical protein
MYNGKEVMNEEEFNHSIVKNDEHESEESK